MKKEQRKSLVDINQVEGAPTTDNIIPFTRQFKTDSEQLSQCRAEAKVLWLFANTLETEVLSKNVIATRELEILDELIELRQSLLYWLGEGVEELQ